MDFSKLEVLLKNNYHMGIVGARNKITLGIIKQILYIKYHHLNIF